MGEEATCLKARRTSPNHSLFYFLIRFFLFFFELDDVFFKKGLGCFGG